LEESAIVVAVHLLLKISGPLNPLPSHRLRRSAVAPQLCLAGLDDRSGADCPPSAPMAQI